MKLFKTCLIISGIAGFVSSPLLHGQGTNRPTTMPLPTNSRSNHAEVIVLTETNRSDAYVLSVLILIDEHERDTAADAKKRPLDQKIAMYAEMLFRHHSQSLQETKVLAQSLESDRMDGRKISKMRENFAAERAALAKLGDVPFERAFISVMAAGHAEILNIIDVELAPRVERAIVRTHLQETRDRIQGHLLEATEIRSTLYDSAASQ